MLIVVHIVGKSIKGGVCMITLYTSDTCGICRMVKMKLEKKQIPYKNEKDITDLIALGIQRLPVLKLEDGTIVTNVAEINNWVNAQ